MVILTERTLREFGEKHADAKEALKVWYAQVEYAEWATWSDVKASYPSADYVGNDRYVFNIRGNRYRLIARIHFNIRTVYIRFIGTHAAYDKVNASTV
ncbi:mRNA interferase HigB [Hymenobacter daecheongensis DSM 21074]|uniref:mRNA interferase HigB n=1 Tax=Hymenobacter daecheongensis DSM 21074 TaxID=1121955 RepID=A0A1M6M7H4_9BACT|nr:type II toxin-antitoxin system HigB family toxin [Hymenobacter daecheongensis]SHJ79310.1 mRNA interferase HigB [Hymenobacter daecheongensis DSM 21074]